MKKFRLIPLLVTLTMLVGCGTPKKVEPDNYQENPAQNNTDNQNQDDNGQGNNNNPDNGGDQTVEVSSISLSASTLALKVEETSQLVATILPENATNKSVTWASNNLEVVTVSNNGLVTAIAVGTATISATAGDKTATCSVTVLESVVPVSSILISPSSIGLEVGNSQTLSATVLPANATNQTVTWSSSDTSIATVSNGRVTAISEGNAVITARAGEKTATCSVTVTPVAHMVTVNYYIDYNSLDSETVYHTETVKNGSKLTKPNDPTIAPFPEFPYFLGWSAKEIIDDNSDLWNFSTDIVNTDEDVFNLFGIWVSEDDIPETPDYISDIKLTKNSDFTTYENKAFLTDRISLVKLKSVTDGDTVVVTEGTTDYTIRFAYIDAPELNEEYGQAAKEFVEGKLNNAKTIVITNATLSSLDEVVLDSTGERYFGFVWYSKKADAKLSELRCLNVEVVYEGLAREHTGAVDPLHSNFLYSESSAQQAKKNIWTNYVAPENDYGYDHYDGYYGTLTWENGEDLKAKLHDIISKDVNYLSYNWEINQKADHALYDLEMLDVVYSDTDIYYNKTQTYWQREHVFCASLMTGKLTADATSVPGRATDYHNLFAGESSGNGSRGNKNYGVATTDNSAITDRGVANGGYAFDTKNFEPGEYDKGRLARSIFYMDVMYSVSENPDYQPLKVVDDYVTYSAGNCQFAIGNKQDLLNWCTKSVDKLEFQHNEIVYSTKFNGVAQNNRNPFVDYPELIDYIYGAKKDAAGDLKNVRPRSMDLGLEEDGIQYYAIKTAKREAQVGQTYTKSDFTIVGIDNKFQEVPVSQDVASFSSVQLTQIGTKKMSISTDKNTIYFNVDVKQAEADYSYQYDFSGDAKTDFGASKYGANGNGVTMLRTLAGKKWNVTVDHESDIRKWSGDVAVQFGFGTSTRPGVLTLETVDSLTNVNAIKLLSNTNANQTMNVKIYVGDTNVADYTVTGNSKECHEKIMNLSSNLSGKVKIVFTPNGNYSVIFKTIAINEVK